MMNQVELKLQKDGSIKVVSPKQETVYSTQVLELLAKLNQSGWSSDREFWHDQSFHDLHFIKYNFHLTSKNNFSVMQIFFDDRFNDFQMACCTLRENESLAELFQRAEAEAKRFIPFWCAEEKKNCEARLARIDEVRKEMEKLV